MAQAQGAEIIRRQPAVDLVIGPQSYHRLPEMIARAHRSAGERLATDFEADAKFDALPERAAGGVTAFLTVQEGCDRFCTFCVVPYTRGAEYSRPAEDILVEARALAAGGVREITLLGQNVNAYASDGLGLAGLVRRLAAIPGLARIRYTTSHPADMAARADRRSRRGRRADALSAPAGAVRLGPHPEGDEPRPHRRQLPRDDRSAARRRGPTSPSPATSSSASRARPTRTSRRRWT